MFRVTTQYVNYYFVLLNPVEQRIIIIIITIIIIEKGRVWPRGWQMPGPLVTQNLLTPLCGAGKSRIYTRRSYPGGGVDAAGVGWCIKNNSKSIVSLECKK